MQAPRGSADLEGCVMPSLTCPVMRVLVVANAKWRSKNMERLRVLRLRGFEFIESSDAQTAVRLLQEDNAISGVILASNKLDGGKFTKAWNRRAGGDAARRARTAWAISWIDEVRVLKGIARRWFRSINECLLALGMARCPSTNEIRRKGLLSAGLEDGEGHDEETDSIGDDEYSSVRVDRHGNIAYLDEPDDDQTEDDWQDPDRLPMNSDDFEGADSAYIPGTSDPVDDRPCYCRGCNCPMGPDEAGFDFLCFECQEASEDEELKHPQQRRLFSTVCPACGVPYAEGTTVCWECQMRKKVKFPQGGGCLLFLTLCFDAACAIGAAFVR